MEWNLFCLVRPHTPPPFGYEWNWSKNDSAVVIRLLEIMVYYLTLENVSLLVWEGYTVSGLYVNGSEWVNE